jgi:hypothetical protein
MNVDRNWYNKLPVSDAIGSRTLRRWKVTALFAGYAVMGLAALCVFLSPASTVRISGGVAFVVATLACCWGFFSLLGRTEVNSPNISTLALDERQLARRHEAFSRTQPVLGFAIALCAAYAQFAWQLPQLRAPGFMVYLLYGLFIIGTALPTAYLAWTEADPEMHDA